VRAHAPLSQAPQRQGTRRGRAPHSRSFRSPLRRSSIWIAVSPVLVLEHRAWTNGRRAWIVLFASSNIGRAAEDLVQNRWVLGDRAFPLAPAPGVLEHCRWPVRSAGVPLGALGAYRNV
jgi:hypothetical protein